MYVAYALLALAAELMAAPTLAGAPHWDMDSARELLDSIDRARAEGLDPRDYSPEPLRKALLAGPGPELDAAATERFRHLAGDYARGHVGPEDRLSWFITGPALTAESADALMARAIAEHNVGSALSAQLPTDARYLHLRAALATTDSKDLARLRVIRVNMERWRWLPRVLGPRRLEVNVPSYTLSYVVNDRIASTHRVIVGKTATPTPQFSAMVTGLILNPWWEIPDSIVAESVGKIVRSQPGAARAHGYVWGDGAYRQRPGPTNALGRMKLVMPNPFSVYVHDTPSKALFARPVRALSHGCIRTDLPFDLAALLLKDQPGWRRSDIDRAIASGDTLKISMLWPTPIYVLYFTAEADASGKLSMYPDIYQRDAVVAAELLDRGALDYVG